MPEKQDLKKHKLGMALAGGGVKGAAHIGVFKALEENGITPSLVAGTSAGALAAAFFACGYKSDEVLNLMLTNRFFNIKAIAWSKAGMMDVERTLSVFNPYFKDRTFESLDIELHIMATDIINGNARVFRSGPILKPLMASCAFPFIFAPVDIEDSLFSDGGIINNFPTETVVARSEKTLGVYVSPLRHITKDKLVSSIDVADRAYRISNRYESIRKLEHCTWVINPPELQNYGTFTVSKMLEIYEIGYKYGKELAPLIKKDLEE
jgi:NTE family protein